jgi:hypothetical protein
VESRLSGTRITSGSTKNRTDNLQNQSAAIAPLCPSMQETPRERSSDSTKRKRPAILLPCSRETSVMRRIDEQKAKMGQFDFKGFLCSARASRRLEKGHRSGEPGAAMRQAAKNMRCMQRT